MSEPRDRRPTATRSVLGEYPISTLPLCIMQRIISQSFTGGLIPTQPALLYSKSHSTHHSRTDVTTQGAPVTSRVPTCFVAIGVSVRVVTVDAGRSGVHDRHARGQVGSVAELLLGVVIVTSLIV